MFWRIFALNEALVLVMYLLARLDWLDSAKNMRLHGYPRGVAVLSHGGWWADATFIPFVMGFVTSRYFGQWRTGAVVAWFSISVIGTVGANYAYAGMSRQVPNFTACDGHLTAAGWLHAVYTAWVFGTLLLFFFETRHVLNYQHVIWLTLAGVAHLLLGFVQPAVYIGDFKTNRGVQVILVVLLGLLGAGFSRLTWFVPR